MEVIRSKTAKLFEAACQLGAILAGRPGGEEQELARYGMHLGTAFQLIDDVLDYSSGSDVTGKRMGDDLAEGKPTLPLIRALSKAAPDDQAVIRGAIASGGRDQVDAVLAVIQRTKALEYARAQAEQETTMAIRAVESLPPSAHRDALIELARFAVERKY